ncbi:MAG: hypothetical protein HQL58_02005 [Magnetococcales bacterium]|nr:hypothetical protein [Magnetococcales bacterium]
MTERGLTRRQYLVVTGLAPLLLSRCASVTEPFHPQGIRSAEGPVEINGNKAHPDDPIPPQADITTGGQGDTTLVIGDDALMIRPNSRVRIMSTKTNTQARADAIQRVQRIQQIQLLAGGVLSVLGKGQPRTFKTAQAVVAIRGTALYLEAAPQQTYLCTCYGSLTLTHAIRADIHESLTTQHHEAPRTIYDLDAAPHPSEICIPAPMLNHTDAELIALEALVGRVPPFVVAGDGPKSRY